MTAPPLARWLGEFRGQLAESALLRIGLMAIIGIVWVYALLIVSDRVGADGAQLEALNAQLSRLRPLAGDREWARRAADADQQLKAMQAMVWVENDMGLAEAAFQDWVRGTAGRAGLGVRQLNVARVATPGASAPASGQPQLIRARLVAEVDHQALLGFLSEVARNQPAVVVERLLLRAAAQPPTAEIDLRILARDRRGAGR